MARPTPFPVLALALLLAALLSPHVAAAQAPVVRIAFSKYNSPPGWTRYNPTALSRGVAFWFGGISLPFAFRTYIRKPGGFSYLLTAVPPGRYAVRAGVVELAPAACRRTLRRIFHISANAVRSSPVDIVRDAACRVPYVVVLRNVRVDRAGELRLVLRSIAKSALPPVLSNFELIPLKLDQPPTTASPPTTTTTIAASGGRAPAPGIVLQLSFQQDESPPGYKRFRSAGMSKGAGFSASMGISSLPAPYRRHVKRAGGLRYTHPVPPGVYDVMLGFAEIHQYACKPGKRVFDVRVANRVLRKYDVFSVDGCRRVSLRVFRRVTVGANSKLVISLSPVSGTQFPPFLSTLFVAVPGELPSPPVNPDSSTSPNTPVTPDVPESEVDPPPSEPSDQRVVRTLNMGGMKDDGRNVMGDSEVSTEVVRIKGTRNNAKFAKYRFGAYFTYFFRVHNHSTYSLNLHFAESAAKGCRKGFRVFNVYAYDLSNKRSDGVILRGIDVFDLAGCRTAFSLSLRNIAVGQSGRLAVAFERVLNSAMISALEITTLHPKVPMPFPAPEPPGGTGPTSPPSILTEPTSPPPPTVTDPTSPPPPTLTDPTSPPSGGKENTPSEAIRINVGSGTDGVVGGANRIKTNEVVTGTVHASTTELRSARVGNSFSYSFKLNPGAYNVFLAFAEVNQAFCKRPGRRVFNVYINDNLQLEGYDIFQKAGCRKGVEEKIFVSVDAFDPKPLVIRFDSVVGSAILSFLLVNPDSRECVPPSSTAEWEKADHAAHSVPGSYPPQLTESSPKSFVDVDGDGEHVVQIDGSRSHTHYVDVEKAITGKLIGYTWTIVETGEVISKHIKFRHRFKLGTTRLRLSVLDNSCSTDEVETTVTVTAAMQPGVYCYYYRNLTEIPIGNELGQYPRPEFAAVSNTMAFPAFPSFPFSNTMFAMRCNFFLGVNQALAGRKEVKISTFGTGGARVYKGGDMMLDSSAMSSTKTLLPVGLTGFEITYLRTKSAIPPKLTFMIDGSLLDKNKLFHDRRTVLPVIESMTPDEGQSSGGTTVKIFGYGLYQPLRAVFGVVAVTKVNSGASSTQFSVISPPLSQTGNVELVVKTGRGLKSNALPFSYGSLCDSVGFEQEELKEPTGQSVAYLKLPVCAAIWQDGKIYMGTLSGSVQVLGYNRETLRTTSHCYSETIKDIRYRNAEGVWARRNLLGITFDPRDKVARPYVSASTLFAASSPSIDEKNKAAWRNGAVERLKPGNSPTDKKVCLVYDKRIVSNLPVSRRDHSVNALMFTQGGDLLISVGGMTNAGLPGVKMGSQWETEMSGAILIAKLSKPSFDGDIQYTNANEHFKAKKVSGDVEVYAPGMRNAFAMAMTNTGDIYTTDQGPNCYYGDVSTSCSNFDISMASTWDYDTNPNWRGSTTVPSGKCDMSISRKDKVLHVTQNSFYGHPNIARGGSECAWVDPYSGKTAEGNAAPSSYKAKLTMLESSVTGIGQYRGNHFCGSLKNELILTRYKFALSFRMGVNGHKLTSGPSDLMKKGGLMFVENAHGELLMPKYEDKKVLIFKPKISPSRSLFAAGVSPFRHGVRGGTSLTVGGSGFGSDTTVTVGGLDCKITKQSETELVCTVPGAKVKGATVDVTVKSDGRKSTVKGAILYMRV